MNDLDGMAETIFVAEAVQARTEARTGSRERGQVLCFAKSCLNLSGHGKTTSTGIRWGAFPRHLPRRWTRGYLPLRRRPQGLPQHACGGLRTVQLVGSCLLLDDQPLITCSLRHRMRTSPRTCASSMACTTSTSTRAINVSGTFSRAATRLSWCRRSPTSSSLPGMSFSTRCVRTWSVLPTIGRGAVFGLRRAQTGHRRRCRPHGCCRHSGKLNRRLSRDIDVSYLREKTSLHHGNS